MMLHQTGQRAQHHQQATPAQDVHIQDFLLFFLFFLTTAEQDTVSKSDCAKSNSPSSAAVFTTMRNTIILHVFCCHEHT